MKTSLMNRGLLAASLAMTLGAAACTNAGDANTETTPPTADPVAVASESNAASIARISNARYDQAVRDLLGVPALSSSLPTDTTNDFASADTFEKYFDAADALGEQVFSNPLLKSRILTCDPGADAACTRSLVTTIASKAWNGPVASTDVDRLTKLANDAVAVGETPADSIKQVVKTVLASPQFLYQVTPTPSQQL
ncbi:MAG TPA: DUF1595 domain-containing protein [Polyangia bacterium]|nr:DUF1595 domain-containing protein [Polyangia bacterium]